MLWVLVLVVVAYLVGSVPFGYLIARSQGIDIRTKGSGNIGATNVWRVMGRKWGLTCFILDFLKGLIPSALCAWLVSDASPLGAQLSSQQATLATLAVATACVVGHVFPVWLKFKGGKGIATSFGALLGIWPVFTLAALIALVVWIISAKLTRMVGISSCLAAVALTAWIIFTNLAPTGMQSTLERSLGVMYQRADAQQAAFACVLGALIIIKHRANIARTIAGTESKIGAKRA